MPGPLGAVAGAKTLHGRRPTPNFTFGLLYTSWFKKLAADVGVYMSLHTPLIIPLSCSPFVCNLYMFAMMFIYAISVCMSILVKGQLFLSHLPPLAPPVTDNFAFRRLLAFSGFDFWSSFSPCLLRRRCHGIPCA